MKYDWLIERLKSSLPGRINYQEFNWGTEAGISYVYNGNADAVKVDRVIELIPVEFAEVIQDDGSYSRGPIRWKYKTYSLNNDPLKEKMVEDLIKRWKAFN